MIAALNIDFLADAQWKNGIKLKIQMYTCLNTSRKVDRWSNAIEQSRQRVQREHQATQRYSSVLCLNHWLPRCCGQQWTVETRCQCSCLWWSAAWNLFSHKTPLIHSNSTANGQCRNNSSSRSLGSTLIMLIQHLHRWAASIHILHNIDGRCSCTFSLHDKLFALSIIAKGSENVTNT